MAIMNVEAPIMNPSNPRSVSREARKIMPPRSRHSRGGSRSKSPSLSPHSGVISFGDSASRSPSRDTSGQSKSGRRRTSISMDASKGVTPVRRGSVSTRRGSISTQENQHMPLERPLNRQLHMNSRLLIGRGRDGLVYRFGSANISHLNKEDFENAIGWGGFVAKVPRFAIQDLPQHYVQSLLGKFKNQPRVVDRVRRAMMTNLDAERSCISALWAYLSERYLPDIGFPAAACSRDAWMPSAPPRQIEISGTLHEDGRPLYLQSVVDTAKCHLMPEALMDGFQALLFHRTENLLLNFCRDILFQMEWLERRRTVHGDLKLSNVLLLTWDHKHYVFVLADFWDAFSLTKDGVVEQLDPKKNHPDYEMRKLQRWKFHYEKFGTRLYKDPELLDEIRRAKNSEDVDSVRPWEHLRLDASSVNMWSFLMMLLFMLGKKSKMPHFKSKIRDEILYSGTEQSSPLPSHKAIEMIRDYAVQLNRGSQVSTFARKFANSENAKTSRVTLVTLPLSAAAPSTKKPALSDQIREKMIQFIGPRHQRPSASEFVSYFKLYDPSRPSPESRDIQADLGICQQPQRCRVCNHNNALAPQ